MSTPCLFRRQVAVAVYEARSVVLLHPPQQRLPDFLDVLDEAQPQQLLLECPDEPLSAAIALRARTNAGLDWMPRKRSSACIERLTYWLP